MNTTAISLFFVVSRFLKLSTTRNIINKSIGVGLLLNLREISTTCTVFAYHGKRITVFCFQIFSFTLPIIVFDVIEQI